MTPRQWKSEAARLRRLREWACQLDAAGRHVQSAEVREQAKYLARHLGAS